MINLLKFLSCFLFFSLFLVADDIKDNFVMERMLKNSQGEVVKDFSDKAFAIKGIHKKLGLSCNDCHKEKSENEFSSAMNESCLECHGSYKKLAEATGALGHNDNIHSSPHYESLDCDNCHKSHKPSVNMCLRCHTQDSMKNLIVK